MAVLSGILAIDPSAKVIVISGQGEKGKAFRAVEAGAYDFLTKPVDLEELQLILRRGLYLVHLEREYRELQEVSSSQAHLRGSLDPVIRCAASSPQFERLQKRALPSCCWEKAEPAKRWRPQPFTTEARGKVGRLFQSIVTQSLKTC